MSLELSSIMGWKLELGIAAAVIAAGVIFRKQIGQTFTELGTGIGEAIGGGFGGTISGISSGFTKALPSPADVLKGGMFDPNTPIFGVFGGPTNAQVFGGQKGNPLSIQTADGYMPKTEQTVTPATRDYSDVLPTNLQFHKAFAQTQAANPTLGHAAAVRQTVLQTGLPTPKQLFDSVRASELRLGASPAEAFRVAKTALGIR